MRSGIPAGNRRKAALASAENEPCRPANEPTKNKVLPSGLLQNENRSRQCQRKHGLRRMPALLF